jgi:hypothetical protein
MFKHLKEKRVSYLQHLLFAGRVALRLSLSSFFFTIHAVFPFVKIPYDLNLESMALYLFERNNDLEN